MCVYIALCVLWRTSYHAREQIGHARLEIQRCVAERVRESRASGEVEGARVVVGRFGPGRERQDGCEEECAEHHVL